MASNFDSNSSSQAEDAARIKELYLWQILEGDASVGLPMGLIEMFAEFMKIKGWSSEKQNEAMKYFELLQRRARGELRSGARFLRDFVMNHPEYKRDSVISKEIAFDLVAMMDQLNVQNSESRMQFLQDLA